MQMFKKKNKCNNGQSAANLLMYNNMKHTIHEASSTTISKESTSNYNLMETVTTFNFYVLRDPRTNEIRYVGRTVNPRNRLRNHIYEAKKNNRNKRERWIISLLRLNLEPTMQIIYTLHCTLAEAIQTEKTLVKKLTKHGFRLKNGNDNYLGAVLTGTPVYQYDLSGKYISKFTSAAQAQLLTGVKDSNIGMACKGLRKSAGKFLWSFSYYENLPQYNIEWRKQKGKPIIAIDVFGNSTEYITARHASKELGVSFKKISAVANGRQKTAGRYVFKFKS
jgi:predicted GIY-YIG superfamily endonuclease